MAQNLSRTGDFRPRAFPNIRQTMKESLMKAEGLDQMAGLEVWSDIRRFHAMPEINFDRMRWDRLAKLRQAVRDEDAALLVLINPVSLRHAIDLRSYQLYQSHIPTAYVFVPPEGPVIGHGAYGATMDGVINRPHRAINFMDGSCLIPEQAELLADDIGHFLSELGTDNRRISLEYSTPSLTLALQRRGYEVIDGAITAESARIIKTDDELNCMRWSIAVAQHALTSMKAAIRPGVNELQLWGLVNYVNVANNGDWHDGRMLASGPRTNPWYQEAEDRIVEAGDLVGVDTDMVGPNGYCADVSRTFHCGPGLPTKRQKQIYRHAVEEIEHNLKLIRNGRTLMDFQAQSFLPEEKFHRNAYTCAIHGVGMCDEFPRINPRCSGPTPYDGVMQTGMVLCVESYMGAEDEHEGAKLEQMVLVTDDGCELLSTMPYDEALMD